MTVISFPKHVDHDMFYVICRRVKLVIQIVEQCWDYVTYLFKTIWISNTVFPRVRNWNTYLEIRALKKGAYSRGAFIEKSLACEAAGTFTFIICNYSFYHLQILKSKNKFSYKSGKSNVHQHIYTLQFESLEKPLVIFFLNWIKK